MAKIVMGIGASHTTLMNTQWAKVDHLPAAHNFKNALHEASATCLLYTSPSPRDKRQSRMPSSA